ncbi:hypothetical protein [Comamonas testosteroni]|uniref:hypothetical protein n=1 Tax=Comamonas testosteroni TaxID=285 RepID=UPI000ACF70E2|nr:hypothetical protein [Comamonas testosteroni]
MSDRSCCLAGVDRNASTDRAAINGRLFPKGFRTENFLRKNTEGKFMAIEVAHIHQGRYDNEQSLLNLRENATRLGRREILDAVNQRLKRCYPNIYQREVGPLQARRRDPKYKCYCNNPQSGRKIFHQIMNGDVPRDCLTCDDCWAIDLAFTWGYFGWAAKVIPESTWRALCEERAFWKFVP